MGWKSEFGADFEIPRFLEFLAKKGIVEDHSWHNDVCPRFGVIDGEAGREVVIWVDHPFAQMREFGPGSTRFIVCIGESCTQADKEISTDDLLTACKTLFQYLAEFTKGEGQLADHETYLKELMQEYVDSDLLKEGE